MDSFLLQRSVPSIAYLPVFWNPGQDSVVNFCKKCGEMRLEESLKNYLHRKFLTFFAVNAANCAELFIFTALNDEFAYKKKKLPYTVLNFASPACLHFHCAIYPLLRWYLFWIQIGFKKRYLTQMQWTFVRNAVDSSVIFLMKCGEIVNNFLFTAFTAFTAFNLF